MYEAVKVSPKVAMETLWFRRRQKCQTSAEESCKHWVEPLQEGEHRYYRKQGWIVKVPKSIRASTMASWALVLVIERQGLVTVTRGLSSCFSLLLPSSSSAPYFCNGNVDSVPLYIGSMELGSFIFLKLLLFYVYWHLSAGRCTRYMHCP